MVCVFVVTTAPLESEIVATTVTFVSGSGALCTVTFVVACSVSLTSYAGLSLPIVAVTIVGTIFTVNDVEASGTGWPVISETSVAV